MKRLTTLLLIVIMLISCSGCILFEDYKSIMEKAEDTFEEHVTDDDFLEDREEETDEDDESAREFISMRVNQVDCSDFPNIRLYVSAENQQGKSVNNLKKKYFTVLEDGSNMRSRITKVMQLDEREGLSIAMVADASGSMSGSSIETAKDTMAEFLRQVQYQSGDMVSLVVFSNYVDLQTEFSPRYSDVKEHIDSIYADGGTALYDTLYTTLQNTARQGGARCVIAFTDGQDEHSRYADVDDVIRISNDYKIPVFIIGIGSSADYEDIKRIAASTGGFYRNIRDVGSLADIYDAIYRQQKEMYMVEYISESSDKYSEHSTVVSYKSREYEGRADEYRFVPSVINPAVESGELESAIGGYLRSYVKAMNESNPSYMEPYVIEDCPLYNTQKKYVNNDFYEELLSFYICSEVQMEGNDSCVLSVHEVYNVETPGTPLYHHEQVATYRMKKDKDGQWKMYEFVGSVKNHL